MKKFDYLSRGRRTSVRIKIVFGVALSVSPCLSKPSNKCLFCEDDYYCSRHLKQRRQRAVLLLRRRRREQVEQVRQLGLRPPRNLELK